MNIEKALNRLNWRFKNENVKVGESKIIINELDVEVVDFLNDWIVRQKEITLNKNILFAKLFCYAFKNEIQFYKNPKQAQRKLMEELEYPIEFHYESILEILNSVEYNKFLVSKGFPDKHPSTLNSDEILLRRKLIAENEKELVKLVSGKWGIETVSKSLNNTITEILNRFPNEI